MGERRVSDIIKAAVEAATGSPLVMIDKHKRSLDRVPQSLSTPEEIAAGIPAQVLTLRHKFAEHFDMPLVAVRGEWTQNFLLLDAARVRFQASINFADEMSREDYADLIQMKERLRNAITGIYLRVFDRMPDEEGFAFWNGVLLRDPEYSIGQIERDMRAAQEVRNGR